MLALTQAHLHLTHPAFQQIIDYCEEGEYLFQILKYTPGFSLSILLERNKKPLSVDFVVDCAKQIADALSYIFSFPEPIIDCSLAPHNLVLDKTGQIHIMDFFCPTPVLTEDYTCILQMGYSAPERFSGIKYADVRTYIYELGMVMHYLLTGIDPRKPPYFIPFTENQLPKGMEYIIKKCTVKDPGARYQNCDELIADLNQYKDLPKPKNFFQKLFRKS